MYAVIKTGGKQYRVSPGDLLVVEKLEGEPGANVAFGDVLMLGEGEAITIGAPTVAGATVSATLIETRQGDKVKIFKKIRRQGYRRTKGHRQIESVLRVTGIEGDGKSAKWDGKVDLTTKAELDARARGLDFATLNKKKVRTAEPVAKAAKAPKARAADAAPAPKPAKAEASAEAAPAAEAPAKKASAPKAKTPTAPKPSKAPVQNSSAKTSAPRKSAPTGRSK